MWGWRGYLKLVDCVTVCVILSMEPQGNIGPSRLIYQKPVNPPFSHNEWSSSLCDCCSGENANCCVCCFACCSNGIGYGYLLEELGLVDSCAYSAFICLATEALTGRLGVDWALFSLRRNLIGKFGINENPCTSCFVTCCCQPCAIAQMERDSKHHKYKFQRPENTLKTLKRSVGIFDNEYPVDHYIGSEMVPLIPYTTNRML
jgi:Cys-rich protein (TIGR01571 family)